MKASELQLQLDRLLQLPGETEWVEFKEARSNFDSDDLGRYFAALSNEANLKAQQTAWLVLGIQDKPRKIVGFPISLTSAGSRQPQAGDRPAY